MNTALSLKLAEPHSAETLTSEIRDVAVINAARHLISRYRAGQAFDIDSFDVPHRALADIAEKLEAAGLDFSMAEPLVEALRRYVLASGGSFTRAVNAKPVVIRMVVAGCMPDRRFENGMTELACIGVSESRVEGAASINVRATPTGTATTSNAADVDAMFSNVKGLSLWVRFEAPTRDDIDALLSSMEFSLAGVVQSVGGAITTENLKELLVRLEEEGALTPSVLELVTKIISLQEGLSAGIIPAEQMPILLGEITALIKTGIAENLIPPALVQAALSTLQEFSSNEAIVALLNMHGISVMDIVADNDNIPTLEDPALGEEILSLLENLAQQIESGEIMAENLPPELTALIEAIGGVEILLQMEGREARIEMLSKALLDDGPSPLSETLHAAVLAIADLDQSFSLPPATLQLLQNFTSDNPQIVEIATTNTLVRTMTAQLATMDAASPEAADLAQVIELLKQDGFAVLMDKDVQAGLPPTTKEIIQSFAQNHPVAIEIAATSVIVSGLQETLLTLEPASPQVVAINTLIAQIEEKGATQFLEEKSGLSTSAAALIEDVLHKNTVQELDAPQGKVVDKPVETKTVADSPIITIAENIMQQDTLPRESHAPVFSSLPGSEEKNVVVDAAAPTPAPVPQKDDPCIGPCKCLDETPIHPTKAQWEETKSRLDTLAQESSTNAAGIAVPLIQAAGDETNPTIIITHLETGPDGLAKVTTMTLAEYKQDGADNDLAREELQEFTQSHVSADALREALEAQAQDQSQSLHVHFGNCCGTESDQAAERTIEQDNVVIAGSTMVVTSDANASNLDLSEAVTDSRTKAMSDAFGFNDFKL